MMRRPKKILVVLAVLGTLIISCGGGGSSPATVTPPVPPPVPPPGLPPNTISWDPPTMYTDSSALNPGNDLDRFEIYVKQDGNFLPSDHPFTSVAAVDPVTKTIVTSYDLGLLAPYLSQGVQYFVSVRVVTVKGMKSAYSPSASFSL